MAPKTQRPARPKKGDESPAAVLLSEAERAKQQAERKPDAQAREPLLSQCVKLLQQALGYHLPPHQEDEVLFDLGEVYALLGSSVQASMYQRLGSIFSGNLHKANALRIQSEAVRQSVSFYRTSHEMYEKIIARDLSLLKQDAAINSGNSLCDWAELMPAVPTDTDDVGGVASSLLKHADTRYSAALSVSSDDVELLTNYADCNIKRAEVEMLNSQNITISQAWMASKDLYTKAMAAYGHACSLADARVGDDLAGLLQNWGAGLLSLAENIPDPHEAKVAYDQAMEKLKSAAKFCPTDVSIFIAIGEACYARSEKLGPVEAFDLLAVGIEEGFSTAMKVDMNCLDAVLGKGESHLAAGKLAQDAERLPDGANDHFLMSFNSYMRALQILKADVQNECKLKFEEQCNVVFNLACVAALCDQESVAREALTLLLQAGGISASDVVHDPDLQSLRTKDWFCALLQSMGE